MPSAPPDVPVAAPADPSLTPIAAPDPGLLARFVADLNRIRPLGDGDRLGIAVSGGADSLALLLLACAAFPGRVETATVDHGLRPESAGEAAMVGQVCTRLDVAHAVLNGEWRTDGEGVQAAARAFRYRLLSGWAAQRGLTLLATAHHADDQAETMLMRLARGSGISGLSAIRPLRRGWDGDPVPGDGAPHTGGWRCDLIRPLLRFKKAELQALVIGAGLVPVADPSNDDPRYDRTVARRMLAANSWLDPARLAATASHLADADAALDWIVSAELGRRVVPEARDGLDEWRLDPAGLPDEILRRLVNRLVNRVEDQVGRDRRRLALPGPELARLVARLKAGQTATLRHVLARPGRVWRFGIAPPRKS